MTNKPHHRLPIRRFVVITGAIFGIAMLAFWHLDFEAMQSQSRADHTLSTSTLAEPDGTIVQARGVAISLADANGDLLLSVLSSQLAQQLQTKLPKDKITHYATTVERTDSPLLLIEITQRDVRWTPFWASAHLTAQVAYASDGDVSWRQSQTMVMNSEQPTVHARGNLHIVDNTQGLISRRAYQEHLGKQMAAELYKMLQKAFFDPPG